MGKRAFPWTIAFLIMMLVVSYECFIPRGCSFEPPDGCTCANPGRHQVTCKPEVPLVSFPEITENMTALHTLNLEGNNIGSINAPICQNCINLKRLILSDNKIQKIDKPAFQGLTWPAGLEYLDLSLNELTDAQRTGFLEYFVNLKTLRLSHNKIHIINYNEVFMGTNLRELYLEGNPLYFLRISLTPLEILSVSFDTLAVLTYETMPSMSMAYINAVNLRSFQMTGTKVSVFSMLKWQPTSSLTHLRLENAQINDSSLADIKFYDGSLTHLSLKHNKLSLRSSAKIFTKRMQNLQYLDLSHNAIIKIRQDTFLELKHLEILYLNHNKINVIDWNFLSHLTLLKKLDLRYNEIKSTHGFFGNIVRLPRFSNLLIGDNPFSCTCDVSELKYLLLWQRQNKFHIVDPVDIRCASPRNLSGHLVVNVNNTSC